MTGAVRRDRIRLEAPCFPWNRFFYLSSSDEEDSVIRSLKRSCSILHHHQEKKDRQPSDDTASNSKTSQQPETSQKPQRKRKRKDSYIGTIVNSVCCLGINSVTRHLEKAGSRHRRTDKEKSTSAGSDSKKNSANGCEIIFIAGKNLPQLFYSHLPTLAHLSGLEIPIVFLRTIDAQSFGNTFGLKKLACIGIRDKLSSETMEILRLQAFGTLCDDIYSKWKMRTNKKKTVEKEKFNNEGQNSKQQRVMVTPTPFHYISPTLIALDSKRNDPDWRQRNHQSGHERRTNQKQQRKKKKKKKKKKRENMK
eukprot:g3987.t1